jgi:hypothetical protein
VALKVNRKGKSSLCIFPMEKDLSTSTTHQSDLVGDGACGYDIYILSPGQ